MKASSRMLWPFVLAIMCTPIAHAQLHYTEVHQNFRHLDLEDGLPDLEVRVMLEDTFGFVWVGTGRGLFKFDGQRVIPLQSESQISLPSLFVHCLVPQGKTIWMGTNRGLFEIDTYTDKVTPHPIHTGDSTSYLGLIDLAVDKAEGTLWLGFGRTNDLILGGLLRYDPKTEEATIYSGPEAPTDVRCIVQDSRDPDLLWTGGQSFHQFRKSNGVFAEYVWPELRPYSLFCHDIVETKSDSLLLGTSEWGVVPFVRSEREFADPILIRDRSGTGNRSNHILPLEADQYLISSTANPPWILDLQHHAIKAFSTGRDSEPFRTPVTVTSSCIVGKDCIALSSFDGIFLLNPELQHFTAEEITPSNEIEARGMHLEQPIVDANRNRVIIPAYYGIVVLDTTCTRIDTIITRLTGTLTSAYGYESAMLDNNTYAVLNRNSVISINANDLSSKSIFNINELPYNVSLSTMTVLKNGQLWIGTRDNYYIILHPGSGKREIHRLNRSKTIDSTAQVRVYSFSQMADGQVYTGSANGLFVIDPKGLTARSIQDIQHDWTLPPGEVPASLQAINDSLLAIGTMTGLHVLNNRAKTIAPAGEVDGGNFFVGNLTLDADGRVWGVTQRGLIVYDHQRKYFRRFTLADGLQELVLSRYGIRADQTGHVYLTYKNTIARFEADAVAKSMQHPRVRFTGFRVLGDDFSVGTGVNALSTIQLKPGQGFLNVSFTNIDFGPGQTTYYEYRIPKMGDAWQPLGTESSVTFSQLKAGKYEMHVRASYDNIRWEESDRPLTWNLPAYFYQQWWFITLLILIGVLLIWRAYNWRIELLRQQEDIRTRAAEAEMQALRAQMNPHFIFNSLNSIKSFIANNDRRNAADYLSKFSKLIRLILNNSKQDWVTLADELQALKLYIELEAIRLTGKINYEINVGPDVETDYVEVPPLIFQPYVENAIWHGLRHKPDGGLIKIDVHRKGDRIQCIIEDNGVGRDKAAEFNKTKSTRHNSLGTSITQERLSGYFAKRGRATIETIDLYDTNGSPAGTKIIIDIPVN